MKIKVTYLIEFNIKNGKVNPQEKKFVFLGVKRNGYRLWDPLYAPEKERGNCCKDFFESDEKITTRLFLPVTREGGC